MVRYEAELQCAIEAAEAAGAILRAAFHDSKVRAVDVDPRAEREILRLLTERFPAYGYLGEEMGRARHPQEPGGAMWVVDPNDGSDAFDRGFRGASVSVALVCGGRPVLGVVYAYAAPDDSGDLFAWAEGCGPLTRNGRRVQRPASGSGREGTVLVSQDADRNSAANASLAAPLRFRGIPGIAYRLALVAAGEGSAAVSLNGPRSWDYAGGHALLLGAGMDLLDAGGEPVRYDRLGEGGCGGRCFGGPRFLAAELARRNWDSVRERPAHVDEPYSLCWPKRGLTVSDAGVLSRAQGCLLGQVAGDSLGSLVEFRTAAEIAREYPGGPRLLCDGGGWDTLAGQPTDDSEMALMLGRSIVEAKGFSEAAAVRAYAWWKQSGPFDIGSTTSAALAPAARALVAGGDPVQAARECANRESQANGALMRVSPLGIALAGRGGAGSSWGMQDAALTHPHAVCRQSSAVFAEAIAFAIRTGAQPEAIHAHALAEARRLPESAPVCGALEAAAKNPPADYMRNMGWVLTALHNAFWQLLRATGLEEGVVSTVAAGGDTDTNGAIAGALLGAAYGRSALPAQWLDRVLTCRPLAGLPEVQHPRPRALWPVDALVLAERLLASHFQNGRLEAMQTLPRS